MKEEEIRPKEIFDQYLHLCEKDSRNYFDDAEHANTECPACCSEGDFSFHKNGFYYAQCPNCQTLFVTPRPSAKAFSKYYTESESAEYWATTFYKHTAEARREKLWKPKAKMVREAMQRFGMLDADVIDIGGGYGIFSEEYEQLTNKSVIIIEPGPGLAKVCRDRGLKVVEKFLEEVTDDDLPQATRFFVSFELFEHLHDPASFFKYLNSIMKPEDLFLFTTLSGTGVDIQVLWEHSKSVSPPHHLNFLNPISVPILLGRCGFEALEITTPGKLDIDIMKNSREYVKDRFWKTFLDSASETDIAQWQKLVTDSGWSSHMMTICRKTTLSFEKVD